MTRYLAIFGRLPELGHAELLAVAPRFDLTIVPSGDQEYGLFDAPDGFTYDHAESLQQTLGGTVRLVEVVAECTREELMDVAAAEVLKFATEEGKVTVGISIWTRTGMPTSPLRFGKPLKKVLTENGRSIRLVMPAEPHTLLGGGTLLHNGLAKGTHKKFELFVIIRNGLCLVGITTTAQDIEDYGHRDFGIPRPDAVSGMLPPKLAQTMVNLAIEGNTRQAVYDPFCGNGRILLEATLQELSVFGSDIRDQQVEASKENLVWLSQEYDLPYVPENQVWQADATQGPGRKIGQPFVIASEPYLGRPLRSALHADQKQEWLDDLVPLYIQFFEYWASAKEQPNQMIIIFPRTTAADGTEISVFDVVVDRLGQVGYSAGVLFCYSREDSIVRRDVVKIRYTR